MGTSSAGCWVKSRLECHVDQTMHRDNDTRTAGRRPMAVLKRLPWGRVLAGQLKSLAAGLQARNGGAFPASQMEPRKWAISMSKWSTARHQRGARHGVPVSCISTGQGPREMRTEWRADQGHSARIQNVSVETKLGCPSSAGASPCKS